MFHSTGARAVTLAVATLAALGSAAGVAVAAQSDDSPGPFAGQDPYSTPCAASATSVNSFTADDGTTVSLMYSKLCATAWAEASNPNDVNGGSITVTATNGEQESADLVNGYAVTTMVDDGPSAQAQASYTPADGSQGGSTIPFVVK